MDLKETGALVKRFGEVIIQRDKAIELLDRAYKLNHEDMGWDLDYQDFKDSINHAPVKDESSSVKSSSVKDDVCAGIWVKASERLPEHKKQVNGRLQGRPAIVSNSKLVDGYVTANGNLEPVNLVEWLDESVASSVKDDEYLSLFNQFVHFALTTFEDASPISSLKKLGEEIKEVIKEIQYGHQNLAEEYIDCMMCILYSAARANIYPSDLQEAFAKKLKINQARIWIKNGDNTYSHEKTPKPNMKDFPGEVGGFEFMNAMDKWERENQSSVEPIDKDKANTNDKIKQAIKWCDERMKNLEINATAYSTGYPINLNYPSSEVFKYYDEMKHFLQSLNTSVEDDEKEAAIACES